MTKDPLDFIDLVPETGMVCNTHYSKFFLINKNSTQRIEVTLKIEVFIASRVDPIKVRYPTHIIEPATKKWVECSGKFNPSGESQRHEIEKYKGIYKL